VENKEFRCLFIEHGSHYNSSLFCHESRPPTRSIPQTRLGVENEMLSSWRAYENEHVIINVFVYVYVCMCVCMHVCACTYGKSSTGPGSIIGPQQKYLVRQVGVCVWVCVCVRAHACMCVCMRVCVCVEVCRSVSEMDRR